MPLHRMHAPGIIKGGGAVKDGVPTDDAVPWGFTSPEAHGAAGDGLADDTAALNAAFGSSTALWLAGRRTYRAAATVTQSISKQHSRCWGCEIAYEGSGSALQLGSAATSGDVRRYEFPFIRRAAQSDWSSEGDAGLYCYNVGSLLMDVPGVRGFTVGLKIRPETTGGNRRFAYGVLRLGDLENCKIGLELDATSSNGWTNENIWFGGRFKVESGVNDGLARMGIKCHSSGTYWQANNNKFFGGTFELNAGGAAGEALCIHYGNLGFSWDHIGYRDADRLIRVDGTGSQGRWGVCTVGYSPAAIGAADLDEVNGGAAAPDQIGGLANILDGSAPNNITALGGVIS